MSNQKEIKNIVDRIVEGYRPEQVILFGSYARGEARKYSDIDLLVIKKTKKPRWERIRDIMNLLSRKRDQRDVGKYLGPIDVKIYTPRELKKEIELGDFFIEEVMEQGRVMYERR